MSIETRKNQGQQDNERLADLEFEITMLDNPEFSGGLHDYLKDAGFLVKTTNEVTPDWGNTLGRDGLEELSLPQVDELVRVAHQDLAGRIAMDVKQGLSVEEAYMSRAATDPAATLIAEATVVRNEKLSNYQKEIEQLKEKAEIVPNFKREFGEVLSEKVTSPNEKLGLEQAMNWVATEMKENPNSAKEYATEAIQQLRENQIDWKSPEQAAMRIKMNVDAKEFDKEPNQNTQKPEVEPLDKAHIDKARHDDVLFIEGVMNALKAKEPVTDKLKDMSTKEFTQLAAAVYVDKFSELTSQGKDEGVASTVAVAKIKDLAKQANLKIDLGNVSDKNLLQASSSPEKVTKLLENNIKPSRLAAMAKANTRGNQNERD